MTAGTAINLILAARKTELAMTCVPPAPQPSYPFGDLVPLGLLAYSLQSMKQLSPQISAAVALAGRHLEEHRVGDLWPFHHGRLPTATDSALILLGQENAHRIDALSTLLTVPAAICRSSPIRPEMRSTCAKTNRKALAPS